MAWIRTALALVGGGVAATQVLPPLALPGGRRVLGLPLIALGAVVALASLRRWRANEEALRLRRPLPHTRLVTVVALGVALTAALAGVAAALSVPTDP